MIAGNACWVMTADDVLSVMAALRGAFGLDTHF
jgi:hypothetical protein